MLNKCLYTLLCLVAPRIVSGSSVVSDWRIRSRGLSPTIGRSYSMSTGAVGALCLDVDNDSLTHPSFDYVYYFKEVDTVTDVQLVDQDESSSTWQTTRDKILDKILTNSRPGVIVKSLFSTMQVDKYYVSANELVTTLAPEALTLLSRGQFPQFFQNCGPNYIRSLRRKSEFSGLFTSESTVEDTGSKNIVKAIASTGLDQVVEDLSSKIQDLNLQISISVVGIKPMPHGTLAPRTPDDYAKAMDYAFKSMMDPGVGLVQSIEVVPWVNNPQFQNQARLKKDVSSSTEISLSPFLRRFYLITNSELIAKIVDTLRHRMQTFQSVVRCLTFINNFPIDATTNAKFLRNKYSTCAPDASTGTHCTPNLTTVHALRQQLVGAQPVTPVVGTVTTYLIQRMANNMDSYMTYYMKPCFEEMTSMDGQISTMQTKHWANMDGCKQVSCTFPGTKWDMGTDSVASTNTCVVESAADGLGWTVRSMCMPSIMEFPSPPPSQ